MKMPMRGENPRPTADFVFRKLFGSEENKDLLIALINSVIAPRLYITDVMIKNPFNLAEYDGLRESIVDIKAKAQDGTWYAIEMQMYGQPFYGKRAIYYAAKGLVDQLERGQQFSALNTSIAISFLGFDFFADSRIARQFVFKDMETNEHPEQLKYLQLYFVEMGKFHKDWNEITTPSDRWVAFLTKGAALDRNNLPAALQADPAIAKAIAELERIGADPKQRAIYEAEEKARMIGLEEIQYAKEQGMEQGIEQGIERGIAEGIQRGQQRMLLRRMTRHLGEAPPNIAARLGMLTSYQLDGLDEALFDFNSYAEIEAWLSRQ
jgi:predicted transposase/invertase (TIGR01784 family)